MQQMSLHIMYAADGAEDLYEVESKCYVRRSADTELCFVLISLAVKSVVNKEAVTTPYQNTFTW